MGKEREQVAAKDAHRPIGRVLQFFVNGANARHLRPQRLQSRAVALLSMLNLGHQGLDAVEALFGPQALHEFQRERLTVQITAEIQDVRFDERRPLKGGGCTLMLEPDRGVAFPGQHHPRRIDAVGRQQAIGRDRQVGRGEANRGPAVDCP